MLTDECLPCLHLDSRVIPCPSWCLFLICAADFLGCFLFWFCMLLGQKENSTATRFPKASVVLFVWT